MFNTAPGLVKAYSMFCEGFQWALLCPGDTGMSKILPMPRRGHSSMTGTEKLIRLRTEYCGGKESLPNILGK